MFGLTIVTATRPARLSKAFRRGEDGALAKEGGGVLVEGRAEIAEVTGLAGLAGLLPRLGPAQALAFGLPQAPGQLLSRAAFERAGRPEDATTRTRDAFAWNAGPGVMMLDHDPGEGEVPLGRDALAALLRAAAPGLADAALLWWPSASSHICDAATGADLTGLRGQRLYLLVADARDIPRAGAALVDRLWASGHGRIVASRAGAALERCPLDAAVWQPERLDFAAGAVCGPGLVQRRGAPLILPGRVEVVDTRSALPEDAAIREAAAAARAAARQAAGAALAAAREAFVEAQADAMLAAAGHAGGETGPERRTLLLAIARRAVEHAVLAGDWPVEVETAPGSFETVTVGAILDRREHYHGRLTRDPLEPGYDHGRTKGKLFLMDARPTLWSFAHGGRSFRLIRAPFRIEVVQGRTAEATDATLERLRGDPAIFDFGGAVALVTDGGVQALDEHALAHWLAGIAQFWRRKPQGAGAAAEMEIDPPVPVVRQVLSLGARRGLRTLDAVITAPTLRPDGSILQAPGYDPATRLFLDPRGAAFPVIPEAPGTADLHAALDRLMAPFASFPFVDAHARGALLAGLLTAVLRAALPTAPAIAIDAPVQGSGKTLLASCIAALATGAPPQVWPHAAGRDDEEVRKRLFSALRQGSAALLWDNVTGTLDSAALAAMLTAPSFTDRVLGRSESQSVPNRTLVLLTGNNLTLAGDLPRRVLTCRIDPESAAPFARRFDRDPLAHVLARRGELVAAALTLVRGRLASGAPRAEGRMASFETWDDLVRQTVVWTGTVLDPGACGDPMDLVRAAQGADPEQEALGALLEALRAVFGERWFTAKEVANRAVHGRDSINSSTAEVALGEAMVDILGERATMSPRSVGHVLRFRKGRIARNLRLALRRKHDNNEFRVEAGIGGIGGNFSSPSRGKSEPSPLYGEQPEKFPPKPPNPAHGPDDLPVGRWEA